MAAPREMDESNWVTALVPNSGNARLWKLIAGMFLAVGILGLADRVATISADLHARHIGRVLTIDRVREPNRS
jgi:hypothetical protein